MKESIQKARRNTGWIPRKNFKRRISNFSTINSESKAQFDPLTQREILLYGFPIGDPANIALSLYAMGFRGKELVNALRDLGIAEDEAKKAVEKVERMERRAEEIFSSERAELKNLTSSDIDIIRFSVISSYYRINADLWTKLKTFFRSNWDMIVYGARSFSLIVGLGNSPFEFGTDGTKLIPMPDENQLFTSRMMAEKMAEQEGKPHLYILEKMKDRYALYDVESAIQKLQELLDEAELYGASVQFMIGSWLGVREPSLIAKYYFDVDPRLHTFRGIRNLMDEKIVEKVNEKYHLDLRKVEDFLKLPKEKISQYREEFDDIVIKEIFEQEARKYKNFTGRHGERITRLLDKVCNAFKQSKILYQVENRLSGFFKGPIFFSCKSKKALDFIKSCVKMIL